VLACYTAVTFARGRRLYNRRDARGFRLLPLQENVMTNYILLFGAIELSLRVAILHTQVPPDVEQRRAAEISGRATHDAVPNDEQLAALVTKLDDPQEKSRSEAVAKLRLLARRVDKFGGQRTQRGKIFDPRFAGLVPHLIKAADDKDYNVRLLAMYALADSLHPDAVQKLRDGLNDENEKVRCAAACLLTEFHDASGLEELKKALSRLRTSNDDVDLLEVERVLASMQRITGKSFGPIPMNPLLLSDSQAALAAKAQYRKLLNIWVAWWEWTPQSN
jgi:HEAT repeat protein